MSTVAYASLTTRREASTPNKSTSTEPPGVRTYVDAFAALVPAEVLTMHAVIIGLTTKTESQTTTITENNVLANSFYGLIALSVVLYVAPRLIGGTWDLLDFLRATIPPLAFVGWTMAQKVTAFDAAFPAVSGVARSVSALFLAVILGMAAAALAYKADQKPKPTM